MTAIDADQTQNEYDDVGTGGPGGPGAPTPLTALEVLALTR
jgi:hypothetical protein